MKMSIRSLFPATIICTAGICAILGCDRLPSAENPAQKPVASAANAKDAVVNITGYDHFKSILDGSPGKLLVFDLYADWCQPCRLLAPTYSALAQTHGNKARFFRVDIQRHQDIASALQARGIPLVVFIKDKEVVKAMVGLNPRESYEKVLTVCGPSVPAAECTSKLADAL